FGTLHRNAHEVRGHHAAALEVGDGGDIRIADKSTIALSRFSTLSGQPAWLWRGVGIHDTSVAILVDVAATTPLHGAVGPSLFPGQAKQLGVGAGDNIEGPAPAVVVAAFGDNIAQGV